jgi:hypothetical protein
MPALVFFRTALLVAAVYLLICDPVALPSLATWRGSRAGPAIHTPL